MKPTSIARYCTTTLPGVAAAQSQPKPATSRLLTVRSAETRPAHLAEAVWAAEPIAIRHSTIFENQAGIAGGGIFLISGSLPLNHTIVARNVAPAGPDLTGLLGTSFSPRYSLIGSNAGSGLAGSARSAPRTPTAT